ncbi:MAG: aminoacyl-tRNA hydrolase [Gemmataceae bacterium]|nr:aminoacyl-tRNA hydrolase [Gemmataceae bacterium]
MADLEINHRLRIADEEFSWRFARSGGPGGQNVNKVASKATLLWDIARNVSVPEDVKQRLAALYPSYFTKDGLVQVTSQRHRQQDRNREDCVDKLRSLLAHALHVPRRRKKTKPTRGSKQRRLQDKKHRAAIKTGRRGGVHDE